MFVLHPLPQTPACSWKMNEGLCVCAAVFFISILLFVLNYFVLLFIKAFMKLIFLSFCFLCFVFSCDTSPCSCWGTDQPFLLCLPSPCFSSLRSTTSRRSVARVTEGHMRSGNSATATSWPVTLLLHPTSRSATPEAGVRRKETCDRSSCRHGNALSVCGWWCLCVCMCVHAQKRRKHSPDWRVWEFNLITGSRHHNRVCVWSRHAW